MCISNLFPLHWCTLSFHAHNAKWFVNDSNRTTKWEKFKTWLSPPRCCSRPKEPSTRLYNDIIKIIEIKTTRSIICNEDATAEDLRGRHRFGRRENTIRQRFSDLRRSGCIVDLSPPGWWPVQKRASATAWSCNSSALTQRCNFRDLHKLPPIGIGSVRSRPQTGLVDFCEIFSKYFTNCQPIDNWWCLTI